MRVLGGLVAALVTAGLPAVPQDAGAAFTVPVAVTAQPGAHVGRLRALTVEASYDDGATWGTADVRGGVAVLRHPNGSGFVSLRATASDTAGNSTTQTIVRAYRYA